MKGILHVFKVVTKSWFRSKSGVFFSFLFPLMLLLIFGTVFGGVQDSSYGIYVQNRDIEGGQPTHLSRALENALRSVNALDVESVPPYADLNEYVEKSSSFSKSRILVIPENFDRRVRAKSTRVGIGVTLTTLSRLMSHGGASILENRRSQIGEGISGLENIRRKMPVGNINLKLYTSEGDQSAPIVRSIVHSVVGSFSERSIGARPVVTVEGRDLRERDLGVISYYLPGLIAAFIMVNGIIGVTSNVSEFNRNGVTKRLAATSLDKKSWIIGNILNQTVLAFMLTFVMIGASWVVFGVGMVPGLYTIALILLGATVFSSVGITLGGVIKDVEGANAAGNAIGFPMMFLSGSFWPLETMPGFMQTVAKALPLYYLHDGLRELMIYEQPSQTLIPFALYGVLTVALVAVAVKVTRWKEF